jgi:hypothetical protein
MSAGRGKSTDNSFARLFHGVTKAPLIKQATDFLT